MRRVHPYRFVPQTSDPAVPIGRAQRGYGTPPPEPLFLCALETAGAFGISWKFARLITTTVVPARAGTHWPASRWADEWIPAFAGMTLGEDRKSVVQFPKGCGFGRRWARLPARREAGVCRARLPPVCRRGAGVDRKQRQRQIEPAAPFRHPA